MPYTLTAEADEDYFTIYQIGVDRYGVEQADRYSRNLDRVFQFLSDFPHAARERRELWPVVRAHPTGPHIVIYEIEADGSVSVLRIRHSAEDWTSSPI